MLDSGSGCANGMSAAVCFAAMMPAICALTRASPLVSVASRKAARAASFIAISASARANRSVGFLAETSTIARLPSGAMCVSFI